MGPTAMRTNAPHPGAPTVLGAAPKTPRPARPAANADTSHGKVRMPATTVPPTVATATRRAPARSPVVAATVARATTGEEHDDGHGGAKATPTASMAPRAAILPIGRRANAAPRRRTVRVPPDRAAPSAGADPYAAAPPGPPGAVGA